MKKYFGTFILILILSLTLLGTLIVSAEDHRSERRGGNELFGNSFAS